LSSLVIALPKSSGPVTLQISTLPFLDHLILEQDAQEKTQPTTFLYPVEPCNRAIELSANLQSGILPDLVPAMPMELIGRTGNLKMFWVILGLFSQPPISSALLCR